MKKLKKQLFLVSLFLGILLAISLEGAWGFGMWYEYDYKLKAQSTVWFQRALRTNNIELFANYTEGGLAYYDNLHGNPDWIYPTLATDWDLIKGDLIDIITTARIAANNSEIGSDAYEEAIDHAKSGLDIIRGVLYENLNKEIFHPRNAWHISVVIVLIINLIIMIVVLYHKWFGAY